MSNFTALTAKSFALRRDVLDMIYKSKGGHFGGDFGVMDILVTLYYLHMNISPDSAGAPDRDRLVLSKGHCAAALYAVLCDRGFFPKSDLEKFSQFGSMYIGHPNNKVSGIEFNTGSLGHGLSVGVGIALAGKMDGAGYRVYVVMGDGELAEGSVWEGAMAAGHYKLDNIIAVVDRNRLQISGPTEEIMAQDSLRERWASFGWNVLEANGNSIRELDEAILQAKEGAGTGAGTGAGKGKGTGAGAGAGIGNGNGKPTVIIANTVKGYGYSEAENNVGWHHKVPDAEQYKAAMDELRFREESAV